MNLKEILYKEINGSEMLKAELVEVIREEEEISGINRGECVTKEDVIAYLNENNYPLTEDNYHFAKSYLENLDKPYVKVTESTVNHLDEFSEEDMKTMIDICILKKLNEIEKKLNKQERKTQVKYEYEVREIRDRMGATNISALSTMLKEMSSRGFRVKQIFTNELGKNEFSIGNMGVNSTVDQVVIIFERPIFS